MTKIYEERSFNSDFFSSRNWTDHRKYKKQNLNRIINEHAKNSAAAAAAATAADAATTVDAETIADAAALKSDASSPAKSESLVPFGRKRKHQGKWDPQSVGSAPTPKRGRPSTLPHGTTIISIPVVEVENDKDATAKESALHQSVVRKSKKNWLLNPAGKSYVCILHEYLQHSLKVQPEYVYGEVESANTPYRCVRRNINS